MVAFKGLNVILELYTCNYSLTRDKELSTAAGQKQGAELDKTRWRAGFSPRALCLPPVTYRISGARESLVPFQTKAPCCLEARVMA